MKDYFRCEKGCTGCCPGGSYTDKKGKNELLRVTLTIGDVYRTFKYNNLNKKNFYNLFTEKFKLIAIPPLTVSKEELEMVGERLQDAGLTAIVSNDPKDQHLVPAPKTPCPNLRQGCEVHNTPAQYIICAMQPEKSIINEETIELAKENYEIFPCIKGKRLHRKERNRIINLKSILNREEQISTKMLPVIITTDEKRTYSIEGLKGETQEIKEAARRIMEPFNEEKNRWWQEEVEMLTRIYENIIA
ncbi:MAG: hypothetical protein V1645_03850 [archaeon]